ncbi:MAG: leucine-rich repeat domain-containing protein [Ignavibacteria bacterium]|nr:leucine-rich repeat domain-containing protein [Ignavibacteria bacterium]
MKTFRFFAYASFCIAVFYGCNSGDVSGYKQPDIPWESRFHNFDSALVHKDIARSLQVVDDTSWTIPNKLALLPLLEDLWWSGGYLVYLSEVIADLPLLKVTYVGGNKITRIAPGIRNARRLEDLDLSNNYLTVLPDEICDMPSLKNLDLFCNYISVLPDSIGKLRTLEALDIRANPISVSEIQRIKAQLPHVTIRHD